MVSCNRRFCQPSPKSKDYAWLVKNIKGDTVMLSRYEAGSGFTTKQVYYECGLPDSVKIGSKIIL